MMVGERGVAASNCPTRSGYIAHCRPGVDMTRLKGKLGEFTSSF